MARPFIWDFSPVVTGDYMDEIKFTDLDTIPALTGATLLCQLRETPSSAVVQTLSTMVIDDNSFKVNRQEITAPATSDTEPYLFQVDASLPDGRRQTLVSGRFQVTPDIAYL